MHFNREICRGNARNILNKLNIFQFSRIDTNQQWRRFVCQQQFNRLGWLVDVHSSTVLLRWKRIKEKIAITKQFFWFRHVISNSQLKMRKIWNQWDWKCIHILRYTKCNKIKFWNFDNSIIWSHYLRCSCMNSQWTLFKWLSALADLGEGKGGSCQVVRSQP